MSSSSIRISTAALLVVFGVHFSVSAYGQASSTSVNPARAFPPARVSLSGLYQQRTAHDTGIYQIGSTLRADVRVVPAVTASMSISQATVEHDSLQRVTGVTDLNVSLNYQLNISRSKIVFGVSANLPTGKNYLSRWAYDAAFPMALSQYEFTVPFFGQGLVVAPSLAWAFAASNRTSIGVGVMYRLRGTYEPHRDLPGKYAWGNELSVAINGRWQATPTILLFGDVSFTAYAADIINGIEVYSAGNRLILHGGLSRRMGNNDLIIQAHYRNTGTNKIFFNNRLEDESINATPGAIQLAAIFKARINPIIQWSFLTRATQYSDTFELFNISDIELIRYSDVRISDTFNVMNAGIVLDVSLAPAITVPIRAEYFLGDLTGFNVGIGITAVL